MGRIAFMAAVSLVAVACALFSSACLPVERIGLPHTWSG
jgi:hypothetical protein